MLKHEHRALFGIRVLADDDLATLAADVRKLAAGAFALIEHGLADYAAKPRLPDPGHR